MGSSPSHPAIGCVVAIDLGTANSGFSYRIKKGGKTYFNDDWTNNSYRVATDILLNHDLSRPVAFGPQASKLYRKSLGVDVTESDTDFDVPHADQDRIKDSVLIEKIKLQVLNLKDARDSWLLAEGGIPVHATQAFAATLRHMKTECLKDMRRKGLHIQECDTLWIVTVPAVWQDSQRNFMNLAALESGVMQSGAARNFTILTESEVSAEFCRNLRPEQFTNTEEAADHKDHTEFMVVDAGGGTVDVSMVVQSEVDRLTTSTHVTSGGRWGGETVNENFEFYICGISESANAFVRSFRDPVEEWSDFMRDYDNLKFKIHRNDPSIVVREELVACYHDLVGESLFEGLGANTNMKCDKDRNRITFEKECLQEKRFQDVFQYLEKIYLENDYEDLWEEFYESYSNKERLFLKENDRQHDVVFVVKSKFARAYKSMKGRPFDSFFPRAGILYDPDTHEIRIPSHVMRWGYYDELILEKSAQLNRIAKSRAELWRSFIKAFAKSTYKFDGKKDITFNLEAFPKHFRRATRKEFMCDAHDQHITFDCDSGVLHVKKSVIKEKCYDVVLKELVGLLKRFYRAESAIRLLYLVGGFGKHKYVQRYIRNHFADKRGIKILIPENASLSVLHGTLDFAYNRVTTTQYASKATFFVMSQNKPCILVRKSQTVQVSEILRQEVEPCSSEDESIIEIHATSLADPKGITSKSKCVCKFECKSEETHYVTMCFSSTDIRIFVDEKDTGYSQMKHLRQDQLDSDCTIL